MCRSFATPKVDMKLIKALRETTGAPMADCKKAIVAVMEKNEEDPMTAACNWLRLAGKTQMAKKAGRRASEGLCGLNVSEDQSRGVLVEINSETDFVAKNEKFQALMVDVIQAAGNLDAPCVDTLNAAPSTATNGTVGDHVADVVTALRENIRIGRVFGLAAEENGVVCGYMHQKELLPGLTATTSAGRIGCLVGLKGSASKEDMVTFGSKVSIHIAASAPKYLERNSVPREDFEAEKALLAEQAASSGKPANVIERMVEGRMNKFYEERCLVDQQMMVAEDKPPKVGVAAKKLGLELTQFQRFQLGELAEDAPEEE